MVSSRRLTDQERRQIVRQRAKGAAVRDLAYALKVSPETVYNVLRHGRFAVSVNDSRSRVLTMRVTERDLRGLDAALSRRGIAHRSDAMRCLMLATDGATPRKPTSASDRPLQDWPSGPKRNDTGQLSGERGRHGA